MRCAACAQAITGHTAEFRAGCMGCAARAIARSEAVRKAMDESIPTSEREAAAVEVRDLMRRTMPTVNYHAARADVLLWWYADAEGREAANSASPAP